jgi:hypothetical protein
MNLLLLILSAASAQAGTLMGSCTVQGVGTLPFTLGSNQKQIVGYLGTDEGRYKISVVNNSGTDLGENFFGVVIGVARDLGGVVVAEDGAFTEGPSFRNPPELCPSAPVDARQECLERDARNNPPFVPAPRGAFVKVPNDGFADMEAMPLVPGGRVDPNRFLRSGVALSFSQLKNGATMQMPVARFGGRESHCSAVYTE